MEPRYERNLPALTEEACQILRKKRVLVVGCGGLGGHLIDMLARIGIGAMRVVDGDVFEPSNLNRQLLSEVPLLGISKARAAADRVARVFLLNPIYCYIKYFRVVVLEGNIPSLPFHLLCAFYAAAAAAIGGLIYKKYNHSFLYYV